MFNLDLPQTAENDRRCAGGTQLVRSNPEYTEPPVST